MKAMLHILALLFIIGLFSVCFFACGDDDDNNDDDDTADDDDDNDDNNDSDVSVASFSSYNAGLAYGFVPDGEYRQPLLMESIPEIQTDVLCMQEVWLDQDIQELTATMADSFPYVYRHDSQQEFGNLPPEDEARCDSLDMLFNCADDNCDITEPDGLIDCVFDNCLFQLALTVLSSGLDCLECMAANIDHPFGEIVDYCTQPNPPSYSFGASNGLLLYSRAELTDLEWFQFEFFLTVRVALHAKVDTDNGPVHLYCTHLTAPISVLPYFGEFDSWEAEQLMQIDALLTWVEETAGAEPVVLMGDFNNGPGTLGYPDEFPANYSTLLAAGLADPYTDQFPDQCTYCNDNPLNEDDLDAEPGGVIIDHVYFGGFDSASFSADRIFDEPVTLETDDGQVESRLSDHYGITVTVNP